MKNPLPGMNPYLEHRWGDFHSSLATYMRDAINPGLPPALRARMQERVYVEEQDVPTRTFLVPDVHVLERSGVRQGGGGVAVADDVAVADPVPIEWPIEHNEKSIAIIDAETGGKVITVIEIISPTNKLNDKGRKHYVSKQQESLDAKVNLVEIDLVRSGEPVSVAHPGRVPLELRAEYHISVIDFTTGGGVPLCYPCPLRARLPKFRIPLRPKDEQFVLDLQAVVDEAFIRGRYDDIDYSRPLTLALSEADAAWFADRLSAK